MTVTAHCSVLGGTDLDHCIVYCIVQVWDFNGHCYHSLDCAGGQPADIGQILVLKRSILVVGWAK